MYADRLDEHATIASLNLNFENCLPVACGYNAIL